MIKNKSFTLIELLVVIVIIGILAGVIIVSTSSSINKANFAKAQAFSNTVQQELLLNLVSEWTFNSPAVSGKTEDSWGNNNGTLVGANGLPQIQTKENCVYGTCYLFDGVDDYIDCGNDAALNITGDLTLSVWVFVKDFVDYSGIISTGSGATGQSFSLHIRTEDKITFSRSDGAFYTAHSSLLLPNKWYHVVGVDDGNRISIYINGYKNSSAGFLGEGIPINYFYIGKYSNFFNGSIDDVRIYSSALSTSQIKQEYIAGLNSLLANNSISKEEYDQRLNNLAYDKE